MDAFWGYFELWGPYGLGALAAGLLGYGLVAGFLLRGETSRTIARPFFMSAFFMAVVTFVAALVEPKLGSFRGPFTLVMVLMGVIYGGILVGMARGRPLAAAQTLR